MDILKNTVLCLCCGALGLTLTAQALSSERFRRQIRLIAVLFLLITALSQLRTIDLSAFTSPAGADTAAAADIAERARHTEEQAVAEAIERSLNQAFAEHNVSCTVSRIALHISDAGSIDIDRVFITGDLLTGRVYLREWLGTDTDILEEVDPDA